MAPQAKISEVRSEYDPDEISVVGMERPCAGDDLIAGATESQIEEARKRGEESVTAKHFNEFVWEVDLDERTRWIYGDPGEYDVAWLLTKNLVAVFEMEN